MSWCCVFMEDMASGFADDGHGLFAQEFNITKRISWLVLRVHWLGTLFCFTEELDCLD